MAFRREPLGAVAVSLALVLAAGACSDDSGTDPSSLTPAPTDVDPGPNDTSNAPQTVQGTLRLAAACLALETDTVRYALSFDDHSLGDDAGAPALIAEPDDRVVARDGNVVVLTGYPGTEPPTECGTPFDVESFNSVVG